MATCSFSSLVGGVCGPDVDNPDNVECVAIRECKKDTHKHLRYYKISADFEVGNESDLILARAGKNFLK